jgi:putative transposase
LRAAHRQLGDDEIITAMLFCVLLTSGQISTRKVDGWRTLHTAAIDQPIDLAA